MGKLAAILAAIALIFGLLQQIGLLDVIRDWVQENDRKVKEKRRRRERDNNPD